MIATCSSQFSMLSIAFNTICVSSIKIPAHAFLSSPLASGSHCLCLSQLQQLLSTLCSSSDNLHHPLQSHRLTMADLLGN